MRQRNSTSSGATSIVSRGGGGEPAAAGSPAAAEHKQPTTTIVADGTMRCLMATVLVLAIAALVFVIATYVVALNIDHSLHQLLPNATTALHSSHSSAAASMADVVEVFRKRQQHDAST